MLIYASVVGINATAENGDGLSPLLLCTRRKPATFIDVKSAASGMR